MDWNDLIAKTNWSFFEVIVGSVGIIISVLVAYHIFFRERRRKSLSYQILTETQLISVHKEAKERISILFDGKPAKDVSLLIFKLINDGNISISSSDFEVPLTFNFKETVEIISAEVTETSEKSLKPKISFLKNKINLEPTLLNTKDNFLIKVLINNYEKPFEIEARIIGVKQIKEYEEVSSVFLLIPVLFFLMGLSGLSVVLFIEGARFEDFRFTTTTGLIYCGLGIFLLSIRYLSPKFYNRVMNRVFPKFK